MLFNSQKLWRGDLSLKNPKNHCFEMQGKISSNIAILHYGDVPAIVGEKRLKAGHSAIMAISVLTN